MYLERSWPNSNTRTNLGELSGGFKYLNLDIRVFGQCHGQRQATDTPSAVVRVRRVNVK